MRELIIRETSEEAFRFVTSHVDVDSQDNLITSTATAFNIEKQFSSSFKNIVNLKRVNDIRWINKFFEAVNQKLDNDGIFIGQVLTYTLRNKELRNKYPWGINRFVIASEFIFTRVFPKLPLLKKFYFFTTKGRGRGLSKAETLGRMVSCGFEIVEYKEIEGYLFFVGRKVGEPHYDLNPSFGMFYRMPRIGKGGKEIKVYKLRTMHPYSEYLQKYMIDNFGYDNEGKGKIHNDFRVTSYGKVFRKLWIDELPQLINVARGEMSLVGVRPLSRTRFSEFPKDIQEKRVKYKPGCLPPYVALLMPDEKGNIKAEEIYLEQKEKHPVLTDLKFFWLSVYNIITNKIRSK